MGDYGDLDEIAGQTEQPEMPDSLNDDPGYANANIIDFAKMVINQCCDNFRHRKSLMKPWIFIRRIFSINLKMNQLREKRMDQ